MKHADLLKNMTLEEKASLLSGKNFWESADVPSQNIPSFFLSDGPSGLRKQAVAADHMGLNPSLPATCFPSAASLANSWNTALVQEVGRALGKEAKALRVGLLLGPGICMKRNPRCGRNFEYFSEDPYLAGKLGAAIVSGIQESGVGSCVKHFACNSQEFRRINSDSVVDERALREIYLTAFEIVMKEAHPKAVMTAYNMVNGAYANENGHLTVDILRNEWGFDGLNVTDWGGDNDRILGLKCGNDLEMPGNNGDTDREVIKAVKEGKLPESYVDTSADRIIDYSLKIRDVLKDVPAYSRDDPKFPLGINADKELSEADHLLAKKAADESMVLLKNENGALPLKKEEKVAVIGDFAKTPRYQGAGSSNVQPTKLDTFLSLVEGGKQEFSYVGYSAGFDRYGKKNKKLRKEALELASKADTVLYFMGLDEVTESEGLDRDDLKVPSNQIEVLHELAQLHKKIVVILAAGSVVEMDWIGDCSALLFTALSGQALADSILDMIEGKVNPSGKLSETYLLKYEDTPSIDHFELNQIQIPYTESIYIGYRYFEKNRKEVRFPFGYGLSYTEFAYSDLSVKEDGVRFKVTNTGKVPGKETAQLYIGMKDSKVFRPVKELKGFFKTETLQPGESEEVFIPFDEYSFRYFNSKTNQFEIEKGTYQIYVGASSKDIRLFGETAREGTDAPLPYDEKELPSYYSGNVQHVSIEEFKRLYGRELPDDSFDYCNKKKTRITVGYTTLFSDLVIARGFLGRFVGKTLRAIVRYGNRHDKKLRNFFLIGPYSLPMRAVGRMANMPLKKVDGLILMFNGHFFKGLHRYLKGDSEAPKTLKENHYQKAEKKKA